VGLGLRGWLEPRRGEGGTKAAKEEKEEKGEKIDTERTEGRWRYTEKIGEREDFFGGREEVVLVRWRLVVLRVGVGLRRSAG